jgi:hypothetical protein
MRHIIIMAAACAATLLAYVATTPDARAASCTHPNQTETLRFPCTSTWVNFYWNAYSMDEDDWDDGFGFTNACDTTMPLARTLNAVELLHYAAPVDATTTGDFSGNILHWGGNYTIREFDELDGRCGDGSLRAYTAYGQPDDYTDLYMPFFYSENPVQRAGTLMHESRHADWCGHSGNDGSNPCPGGGDSCDERTGFNGADACAGIGSPTGVGANGYQVLWLWWYLVEADSAHINSTMRTQARDEANFLLTNRFDENPCFTLTTSGGTVDTCP